MCANSSSVESSGKRSTAMTVVVAGITTTTSTNRTAATHRRSVARRRTGVEARGVVRHEEVTGAVRGPTMVAHGHAVAPPHPSAWLPSEARIAYGLPSVRVLFFGTFDERTHPRVRALREGIELHGHDVSVLNEPLGLGTSDRVRMAQRPWHAPILAARLLSCWVRLWRAEVRQQPEVVVVPYLGHFDVHLARRRFRGSTIVLDHMVSLGDTVRRSRARGPGGRHPSARLRRPRRPPVRRRGRRGHRGPGCQPARGAAAGRRGPGRAAHGMVRHPPGAGSWPRRPGPGGVLRPVHPAAGRPGPGARPGRPGAGPPGRGHHDRHGAGPRRHEGAGRRR